MDQSKPFIRRHTWSDQQTLPADQSSTAGLTLTAVQRVMAKSQLTCHLDALLLCERDNQGQSAPTTVQIDARQYTVAFTALALNALLRVFSGQARCANSFGQKPSAAWQRAPDLPRMGPEHVSRPDNGSEDQKRCEGQPG